jgi:hypothetical protein
MGGSEDKSANYHTVSYKLAERGAETIVTLKPDNNASQEEQARGRKRTGAWLSKVLRR